VDGAEEITVAYRLTRDGLWLPDRDNVSLVSATPDRVVLEVAGMSYEFHVARYGESRAVDSALGPVAFTALPRFREPGATLATGSLVAPMPGTVLRTAVSIGDRVRAGDPILWLEAMKMEHQITAPADGVVSELPISVGQQVEMGAVLAVVLDTEPAESGKRFA
jgi:propionyl-CoA carboxylase alpha chain